MSSYVTPHSILGIGVTFIVTSLTAVSVRFGTRLKHHIKLGADDWLCLLAMVSFQNAQLTVR